MKKRALETPILSVDLVVFSLEAGELITLVYRRKKGPFKKSWALPGVAIQADETLEQAARRALKEKGGLKSKGARRLHLEQLATFDAISRDPRGRTVSVAHMGLSIPLPLKGKSSARWVGVDKLLKSGLPFDHKEIITCALTRLRGKVRYTNVASRLLPECFRIEDLQAVYETILGYALNRTNFRGKLLKIGLIERVGELPDAVGRKGGRPPHLYCFSEEEIGAMDRDFL